jgi:hypothetical protein
MERGTRFADIRTEFTGFLSRYIGHDPASIDVTHVTDLHHHFEQWFSRLAVPYQVLVPCVISKWASPRFSVGPVAFVFIDDIARTEFYPPAENIVGRSDVDDLLKHMKDARANWLARVSIEGCERRRAKELSDLATDLAIVALQLAVPIRETTREMGRLDAHRGTPVRLTLSEAGGFFHREQNWSAPGDIIGKGTLAHFLGAHEPMTAAVGRCVMSFATGKYRLRKLETSWCDAAYWLHQALAEPNDAIAVAKLETALEVLMRAQSRKGSQARIEAILAGFYGLKPNDPLHDATAMTAKQFAKDLVEGRSRVLHGVDSTLNPRLSRDRTGAEEFAIAVVGRAALELDVYANLDSAADDHEKFLEWVSATNTASNSAA